jgi:hypothetical protein
MLSNMSSANRYPWRSDADLVRSENQIALLREVAAGRVVRGAGGQTGFQAPYMLDSESVRGELRWLYHQDLIEMPMSGVPSIAPRGRRLLAIANGEIALPQD